MAGQHSFLLVVFGLLLASAMRYYENYPPRELEPPGDPAGWTVKKVQDWVESIGFFEYRDAFAESTVDGKKLMTLTPKIMEDDLILMAPDHRLIIDMELKELKKRKGLLTKTEEEELKKSYRDLATYSVEDVAEFLRSQGMKNYAPEFEKEKIDGVAMLKMTDAKLKALLSVVPDEYNANEHTFELLRAQIEALREKASVAITRDKEPAESTKDEL